MYICGFSAISLLRVSYLRSRNPLLKYFLLSDLFLSLILFFDTLNLCFDNFGLSGYSEWREFIFILGLFAANAGVNYFLLLSAFTLTESTVKKPLKLLFSSTSVFFLAILVLLLAFYKSGILTAESAKRAAYTSITVYGFVWVIYCASYVFRKIKYIPDSIRSLSLRIAFVAVLIPSLSLLSELIQLKVPSQFPIAFSPISFFIINAIIIISAKAYHVSGSSLYTGPNTLPACSLELTAARFSLTEREKEILELALAGATNQEIGYKLFISPNTVKNHMSNIFRKCGVKNRYELIKNTLSPS